MSQFSLQGQCETLTCVLLFVGGAPQKALPINNTTIESGRRKRHHSHYPRDIAAEDSLYESHFYVLHYLTWTCACESHMRWKKACNLHTYCAQ